MNPKNFLKSFFKSRVFHIAVSVIIGIIFVLAVTLFPTARWYKFNYSGVGFIDLLMILLSPKEGTDTGMISDIMSAALPYTITAAMLYIEAVVILAGRHFIKRILRGALCIVCAVTLVFSLIFAANAVGFDYDLISGSNDIYDKYYVDPNDVEIVANGNTKNLIHIYIESMEVAHTSIENGGQTDINYIPNLTELAKENINFSCGEEGKLGGFKPIAKTGWTIAALLATTSGVPFSFSIESVNGMSEKEFFAPGITTLGDVLEEKGYKNVFLCGSDAKFAGRDKYFTQHGSYEVHDLLSARADGNLPTDDYYNGFWGFEDFYLYDIAKTKLTELASNNQPFNFTMLTVDTHPTDGFICEKCGNEYDNITANVVKCADKQVGEFVSWIMAQPFYEDTVIVITGDHTRMDNALIVDKDNRGVYNCFINSAATPKQNTFGREFVSMDIFPTTLAAMGFEIEGNRLGLGTNMFSYRQTLVEELGYKYLNNELYKNSDYYYHVFENPELEWKKDEN